VASTLLKSLGNDGTLPLQEKIGLAMWILEDGHSLQEINTRLRDIRSLVDRRREQLLDASGAIHEATADINHYVRTTIREAQEVEGHKSGIVKLDHEVKRLEIQIAEGGRMSRGSFDAVSPSSTEFEDIEAYGKPLDERYDGYLQFDDDESVTSAKTV
jgi:hypothetical protein